MDCKEFPVPTKTMGTVSTALCTSVTGGCDKDGSRMCVVELLNTETLQWSTPADLPQPLLYAPAAVCGDQYDVTEPLIKSTYL